MATLMLTCEERVLLNCCICNNLANDPVLLSCFCSCCSGCVEAIRCGESIECPLCKEKSEIDLLEKSTYVSAQINMLKARNDLSNCDHCEEKGVAVVAQYRCQECQNFLCEECFDEHSRHVRQHHVEDLNSYFSGKHNVSSAPRAMCTEHKQVLGVVCQQCKCLKCTMCLEACLTAQHDFVGLKQHLANVVKEIQSATAVLTESSVSVDALEQVICESDTSRKKYAAHLEENKIALLDTVASCFDESKRAVEDYHSDTVQETQQAIGVLSLLKSKIERFSMYCKSVAESCDIVSLVNQHQCILKRLTYLENEKHKAPTSIAVKTIVIDNDHLGNIQQIVSKYIGIPKPIEVYRREQELQELQLQEKLEQENAQLLLVHELENRIQEVTDTQRQLQDEKQKSQGVLQQLESQQTKAMELMQELSDVKQLQQNTNGNVEDMQLQLEKERHKTKEAVHDLEEKLLQTAKDHEQLQTACIQLTQNLKECEQKLKDSESQLQKEQLKTLHMQHGQNVLLEEHQNTLDELKQLNNTILQLRQQLSESEKSIKDIPNQVSEKQQVTEDLWQDKCVTLESSRVIDAVQGVTLWDVAVASADSLFVATSQGLREYNSRGSEVSRPLTKGKVYSLDVFIDGRVAAGLGDDSVVILSRHKTHSSGEWKHTATFKTKVLPRCLAVALDGSCLSMAAGHGYRGRVWCIYSCSGLLLLEKDLGYDIRSLATSAAAVVISSWHKREPPLHGHSVEAYNDRGQLLWQRTSSNMVYDLCPDPGSWRVYITVDGKNNGVRVLREEGQQPTEDNIVSGSEALQRPEHMSMDRQATCLAVVSNGIVTVFTVARH